MPSAKPYSLLHKQIVARPGATAALAEHRALTLKEIREHFGQSQITLSEALGVSQPAVSKTESSSDPRLSTLESYVKALGGELKVQAIFEGDTGPEVVTINFTAHSQTPSHPDRRYRRIQDSVRIPLRPQTVNFSSYDRNRPKRRSRPLSVAWSAHGHC